MYLVHTEVQGIVPLTFQSPCTPFGMQLQEVIDRQRAALQARRVALAAIVGGKVQKPCQSGASLASRKTDLTERKIAGSPNFSLVQAGIHLKRRFAAVQQTGVFQLPE
jgi:hypothetical protein